MTAGESIQAAYQKVNIKLGKQDKTITFRKTARVPNTSFAQGYTETNTDVVIAQGIKISRLNAFQVDSGGLYKLNDLKLKIPGNLITEAQIKDSLIFYGTDKHTLVNYRPLDLFSAVVTEWEVVAREKQ